MLEPYFLIKTKDQDEFNLCDRIPGLRYLGPSAEASSPQFTNNYQDVSGRDGSPFVSQTFAKRTINERFSLHFNTWEDYQLASSEIYSIFGNREQFRIRTDTRPTKVYFGYVTPFDIAPYKDGGYDADFTIPFDVPKGYYYSLFRSDTPYTSSQNGWSFGMNLPDEPTDLSYHFTSNSFKVYNASDIDIDPYYQNHDLKIIVKFTGSSLKITNKTTNTEWQFNENCNQQIIIDGIKTLVDGNDVSGKTDCHNLTLKKGWNEIECTGAGSVDITFSFPFIYLK